jgi:CBS domain-containing protein
MKRQLPVVTTEHVVGDVLPRMRQLDRLELVVLDSRGTPVTVLQAGDLAAVAIPARWAVTLGELTERLPPRHIVAPWNLTANEAIERAAEAGADYILVVDPGAARPDDLVGLVTPDDIVRMVKLRIIASTGGNNLSSSTPLAA